MKKLIVLTTALLISASVMGAAGVASAEENREYLDCYPESFTKTVAFDNLTDYAVSDGKYAFLSGERVCEYSNGNFNTVYEGNKTITALYYSTDGAICYGNGEKVLTLSSDEETDIDPEIERIFTIGKFTYAQNPELWVTDYTNAEPISTELENFSNLKKFGNTAYAVKENALYALDGTECTIVKLEYEDFSDTANISTAGAENALKTFSAEKPTFVSLKSGVYKTKVDLNAVSNELFTTNPKTDTFKTELNETALLLFKFGKDNGACAVISSADKQCYILRTEHVLEIADRQPVKEVNLVATADFNGKIYSCPAILESAKLKEISAGEHLTVTGEVLKADNPELSGDFYKVEFEDENGVKTSGYVPSGYLTPFHFDEKPPIVTPDPAPSTENSIKTVILVIVVITLVLIACGYLIYVATSKNKNKKQK